MDVTELTSAKDFEATIEADVALVDFNAPWCAPCRSQEPIIKQLADRFDGKAIIAAMNIDENRDTAVKLGVQSIPTLIVFKNGNEVQRFVGLQSEDTLAGTLEELID